MSLLTFLSDLSCSLSWKHGFEKYICALVIPVIMYLLSLDRILWYLSFFLEPWWYLSCTQMWWIMGLAEFFIWKLELLYLDLAHRCFHNAIKYCHALNCDSLYMVFSETIFSFFFLKHAGDLRVNILRTKRVRHPDIPSKQAGPDLKEKHGTS